MIRQAHAADLEQIMPLTRACAQDMIAKGIFQWNEHYPTLAPFENDFKRKELYILELDSKVMGCVVVSTEKDSEYIPINWINKTDHSVYVHRLAVHPSIQGQGYAQKLMDFAEQQARDRGFDSVRLDTFSQNQRNQRLYEQRGYQRLGNIYFPKQSEHPFYCYELIL